MPSKKYIQTIFECIEAIPMGHTQGGVTPDIPIITESMRGKWKVIMLGSMPCDAGEKMMEKMLLHYLGQADVHFPSHSQGTIVVPRKGEGLEQWILINMMAEEEQLKSARKGLMQLSDSR